MKPYYEDERVTIYHGDCRDILPWLGVDTQVDAIVTDPPYGETSLAWDSWPDLWPEAASCVTSSMWCFGSMRMFLDRLDEFDGWKLSQDVVWEKHNGSGFATDRFKRVHEHALHWYRGSWGDVHHDTPRVEHFGPNKGRVHRRKANVTPHTGDRGPSLYVDDGMRLQRSVIECAGTQGRATHPTEKPVGILTPLIAYAVPIGGLVLDPFAGSGSTLRAAVDIGRRAVGIEADERYCEIAVQRVAQQSLDLDALA